MISVYKCIMKTIVPIFLDISKYTSAPADVLRYIDNTDEDRKYDIIDGPEGQRATYKIVSLEQPLLMQKAISDIAEHIGASVARSYIVENDSTLHNAPKYGFISMHGSKEHLDTYQIAEKFDPQLSMLRESLNACGLISPEEELPDDFHPDFDAHPDSENRAIALINLQARYNMPQNALLIYMCGIHDSHPSKALVLDKNLKNPYQIDFGITEDTSSVWKRFTHQSETALIQEAQETLKDISLQDLLFYVERLMELSRSGEFEEFVLNTDEPFYYDKDIEYLSLMSLGERIIKKYGQIMEQDTTATLKAFQDKYSQQNPALNENTLA